MLNSEDCSGLNSLLLLTAHSLCFVTTLILSNYSLIRSLWDLDDLKNLDSGGGSNRVLTLSTLRLQCSSFLVMTYVLLREYNLLPKEELHLSLWAKQPWAAMLMFSCIQGSST